MAAQQQIDEMSEHRCHQEPGHPENHHQAFAHDDDRCLVGGVGQHNPRRQRVDGAGAGPNQRREHQDSAHPAKVILPREAKGMTFGEDRNPQSLAPETGDADRDDVDRKGEQQDRNQQINARRDVLAGNGLHQPDSRRRALKRKPNAAINRSAAPAYASWASTSAIIASTSTPCERHVLLCVAT